MFDREHEDFYGFCRWLVMQHEFTATNLLEVIEKPYNWETEFEAYQSGYEGSLEGLQT